MNKDKALELALETLEKLQWSLERADCSTGYCCCGSNVDGHTFGDGHSPIDEGEYCQGNALEYASKAITAIKQALALDKMAENARELGLDYEPVDYKHVCNLWIDPMTTQYIVDRCDHPPSECIPAYIGTPPQRKPLTDEQIWKFWWSRPEVSEGKDDSMEAEFVAAVREVLAAHGITAAPQLKENT